MSTENVRESVVVPTVPVVTETPRALTPAQEEVIAKAVARGRAYRVNDDGSVTVFRKDGVTPDARSGVRKTGSAEAPYGYKSDGTPRSKPGRPATKPSIA